MSTVMDRVATSFALLEYEKEYKWLNCSDCGEKVPADRFMVHGAKCLKCTQQDEMYEASEDHDCGTMWGEGCGVCVLQREQVANEC